MRRIHTFADHYGPCLKWLLLSLIAGWLVACAPSRAIYIPPEGQTPPPPSTIPQPTGHEAPRPAPSQHPILRAPAEIREADMPRKSTEAAMDAARPSAAKPAGVTDDPQYLASMHLVDQAQGALSQGDPDNAIAPLEQAIQVDVYNGEAFFGLARAWKMKGSHSKALEFANKAEILFQDNPRKLREVYLLKAELFKELQDGSKAEYYLNKAARLN